MEENSVVFDISSDEEATVDVAAGGDDYSWLMNFLCDDTDDSDDVIVVGEIKSKSSKVTANNTEDDDDCVVLDGDPDRPVAVDDDNADDGDDLVIVSQKGQIACRDYPHPRHLCAKFLFSSTPHETHCDLCHCYVCDIPAPCAHWGTGVSRIDHCHAAEKAEFWKAQRKTFRLEKDARLPVQIQVPDTSLPLPLPQLNQTPAHDVIRLSSSSIPQNQASKPAVIHGCSSSSMLTNPNMMTQFRSQQSGPVYSRHRIPTRWVSQQSQMLRVRNNGVQNPGMFKRPGIVARGGSEVNQFVCGSSNNIKSAYRSQCSQNAAPQATSNDRIDVPWVPSMNHNSFTYRRTSQTGMGNVFVSTVPSQTHNQPLPQPEVYRHPMAQQLVYSQSIPESQLYSQPIPRPQVHTQHSPLSNELGNQVQNSAGLGVPESDEWVSQSSQSNQPPQVEDCQLPITGCIREPLPTEEFNSQCNENAKLHHYYNGFDNWYQESQFGPMSGEYVPSDLDAVTSDPAAFDAGLLLFDFETSFNSLAHV